MRLLLDTNVLIRMLEQPERLSPQARTLLDDANNILFATTISLIEIAIKVGTGKLSMPSDLLARLRALDCEILPILPAHAMRMGLLEPIHKDPFDRLIVAQALVEDLVLMTSDATLRRYPVTVIAA